MLLLSAALLTPPKVNAQVSTPKTGAPRKVLDAKVNAAQAAPLGVWRVERGEVAPWHTARTGADTRAWLGRTVRFDADRVNGPSVLACGNAHYSLVAQPAEGLFQGGLPAPAKGAASRLGITKFPVPGVRLDCDRGSFDFHRVDTQSMLLAVDNVIWTLTQSAGAVAQPTTPSGVMQLFLEKHFAGDMGFDRKTVATKQQWLTDTLRTAITRYFAKPSKPDEVPNIDGDPFTDSQEYPTRFAVADAQLRAAVANVSVRFSDGYRDRNLVYVLHQQRGVWLISDIRYDHGATFTSLLK